MQGLSIRSHLETEKSVKQTSIIFVGLMVQYVRIGHLSNAQSVKNSQQQTTIATANCCLQVSSVAVQQEHALGLQKGGNFRSDLKKKKTFS